MRPDCERLDWWLLLLFDNIKSITIIISTHYVLAKFVWDLLVFF